MDQPFYNYKVVSGLDMNIDEYLQTVNLDKIHICPYEISNKGKTPFLKYIFVKYEYEHELRFPNIKLQNIDKTENIINMVKIYLYNLFSMSSFDLLIETIIVNGFYMYDDEVYLFIDISKCDLVNNHIYKITDYQFVIMDEIVNHKTSLNMNICEKNADFFIENYLFTQLYNEKKEPYEIPVICYIKCPHNKLNYTYNIGAQPADKNAILGPYYYFTDYKNVINDEFNLYTDLITHDYGIVRFAVFTGTVKYIENFHNDPCDESDIKKERINDIRLSREIEQLTIRISDHDGKWTEHFDSAYIGNIELDNGEYMKNTPILVVKNNNQQIPLSYHFSFQYA